MSQQRDDKREKRSDTGEGGAGAMRPAAEPASEVRARKLIAILGVCTAALTLVTAGLGVVSVRFNQQKDQAEGEAATLSTEVSVLSEQITVLQTERDTLAGEVDGLREERDGLQEELEAATNSGTPPESDQFAAGLTYLSDEQVLDWERFDNGTAQVSGETYLDSVMAVQGFLGSSDATQAYAEYDLGRAYEQFTATLGLSDKNAYADRTVKFEVIVDNELIHETTITAGDAEPVTLTITGGLRLRLQVTFFRPEETRYTGDEAVWGDAALAVATQTVR
jgi:NPCBM/NEW2 domain